jgi:hypothetical protein
MGKPADMPLAIPLDSLMGLKGLSLFFSAQLINALIFPLLYLFLFLLISIVLRKNWLSVGVFWLFLAGLSGLALGGHYFGWIRAALSAAMVTFVLLRFGFLALIFTYFFLFFGVFYPLTSDLSAWYATSALFAPVVGAALAVYGFYISLAGQRLFKGGLLED